jgi:hypothetical protein
MHNDLNGWKINQRMRQGIAHTCKKLDDIQENGSEQEDVPNQVTGDIDVGVQGGLAHHRKDGRHSGGHNQRCLTNEEIGPPTKRPWARKKPPAPSQVARDQYSDEAIEIQKTGGGEGVPVLMRSKAVLGFSEVHGGAGDGNGHNAQSHVHILKSNGLEHRRNEKHMRISQKEPDAARS